jgi:hypothetical protein
MLSVVVPGKIDYNWSTGRDRKKYMARRKRKSTDVILKEF